MRTTAADRARWQRVVKLGCLACRQDFGPDADLGPACIHHCRHNCGLGQRKHDQVAPLCPTHHQHGPVSRHGEGAREFREKYGSDRELHEQTERLLGDTNHDIVAR